ncbi:protein containing DUF1499 [Candidatus Magnetomorum sp. HK-1]|nr:protein containing DUF1499 [Candidatus Magnetomorum sp. HK-1]
MLTFQGSNDINIFVHFTKNVFTKGELMKKLNFLLLGSSIFIFSCSGTMPDNLGVKEGKFASCPNKSNCVSSQEKKQKYYIDPLSWKGSSEKSLSAIKMIIKNMPRTKIIKEDNHYLHVEFKSALMGFVDDVEFFADEKNQVVHVRSASRLGYSDFGVNRKRIDFIRSKL